MEYHALPVVVRLCLRVMAPPMAQVDSKASPTLFNFNVQDLTCARGVFTDSSLGLVLYYHYAKTTVGLGDGSYLFGWNKLSWSSGWPVV